MAKKPKTTAPTITGPDGFMLPPPGRNMGTKAAPVRCISCGRRRKVNNAGQCKACDILTESEE